MEQCLTAFWRRLDQAGHDVARLAASEAGWTLSGFAAFHEHGPTGVQYELELAPDFATLAATVSGHRSGQPFRHVFDRRSGTWRFDGVAIPGLDDLIHLDFGFTPATNLQQLLQADLAVGEGADIAAAWFDIGEPSLVRLPQRYVRTAVDRYHYTSPTAGYEATLEMAESGFVRLYPGLWEMEAVD